MRPEVAEAGGAKVQGAGLRIGAVRRGLLVGRAEARELAQVEAGAAEPFVAAGAARSSERASETLGDRQRLPAVLDDGAVGVRLRRLLGRALVVQQRPLPVLAAAEVVRQRLVVLGQPVGVQLLDGAADGAVQLLAALEQRRSRRRRRG